MPFHKWWLWKMGENCKVREVIYAHLSTNRT